MRVGRRASQGGLESADGEMVPSFLHGVGKFPVSMTLVDKALPVVGFGPRSGTVTGQVTFILKAPMQQQLW